MKILNGSDLAGFVKERQAHQVSYIKSQGLKPKLAIIQTKDDEVINTYVNLKMKYGEDIGVEVEKYTPSADGVVKQIKDLNNDDSVTGIIVQLPLAEGLNQTEVLNSVDVTKDVDGLAENSKFDPATPTAILWLLNGYNVELKGKQFVVVGQGTLVGAPLTRMLEASGYNVVIADSKTADLESLVSSADILITAVGMPNLITGSMIGENATVIDAGVAVESGKKTGDLSDDVYDRDDLKITPRIGGVGPLTVCALFDNVIKAGSLKASS